MCLVLSVFQINHLQVFSHILQALFPFLIVSLMQKAYFDGVQFTCFSLIACTSGVSAKAPVANPGSQAITPMVSSRSFTGLALIFRSLIHSELILIDWHKV